MACAITLPVEDGHDKCVACLGFQHDQSLGALVSPMGSALGPTSRNCRTVDGVLLRTHSVMAVQTKLANTTAILSLYLHHLSCVAGTTIEEMQLISSLLSLAVKERAVAAGKVIASLWVARRHGKAR